MASRRCAIAAGWTAPPRAGRTGWSAPPASPTAATSPVALSAVGYNWSAAGENIATGFSTPWAVIKGWMGSTDHCRNILDPQFADLGVGVNSHRLGPYGPSTWTQDFGLWMGHRAPSGNRGPQNGCPYRIY